MGRTIVLGYDGSDCAKAALDAAVDLARDRSGSRIVVVTGHPVRRYWLHANFTGIRRPVQDDLEDLKRHATADLQPLLDEAGELVSAAGVPVETTLEWEAASDALIDVAKRQDADVIVVGAHGASAVGHALGRALLGSTSVKLLHYSPVPVLVVPLAG
jgi:nucleotide-binding universal stress UspA family protein